MGKYFGTDGFRGEAGITLTADHAYKVGRFLGWYYNVLRERNGDINPARIDLDSLCNCHNRNPPKFHVKLAEPKPCRVSVLLLLCRVNAHQCITATHSGQLSIPLLDLLVLDQRIGQAFCQFAVCLCLCVCGNRSLLCSCNSIPVPVDWGGKPRYNKRNDLFTAADHEENKLWK
jgi:hypothetical protein